MRFIERAWTGDASGDKLTRAALLPFEALFRTAVVIRDELFERGVLRVAASPIATISVGNLTVGGTGKTPVSAWIATQLAALGRIPAIVLRGFGDDEPMVHASINPGVTVIVSPDRSAGITKAANAGANVAILDDAFQHRQAARDLDIVLVSSDDWTGRQHLLPAGPYREPPSAISRASHVWITRKSASEARVEEVRAWLARAAPQNTPVVLRLSLRQVVNVHRPDIHQPAGALSGEKILAVTAIGNPEAFFAQLRNLGAQVSRKDYPDHYPFNQSDVAEIVRSGSHLDRTVCTLKDAVKLARLWPATAQPLWYVSLSVEPESGEAEIVAALSRLR